MKKKGTPNDRYVRTSFLTIKVYYRTGHSLRILFVEAHLNIKPLNTPPLKFHHFPVGLNISHNQVSKHNMSVHGIRNENALIFVDFAFQLSISHQL